MRTIDGTSVARRAVLIHGFGVLVGFATLVVSIVVADRRIDGRVFASSAAIALGWFLGVRLALARLRPWAFVVGACVVALCVLHGLSSLAVSGPATGAFYKLARPLALGALSSFLFFAPRVDLLALWFPLGLHVAAAVVWLNERHAIDIWRRNKLDVWDGPSVAFLSLGVVVFVATLIARQRLARDRWLTRPVFVDADDDAASGAGRAVALAAVVVVAVLALAPFLLRTAPPCTDCGTPSSPSPSPSSSSSPSPSPSSPRWDPDDWSGSWRALRLTLVDGGRKVLVSAALLGLVGGGALPLFRRRRLRALAEPDGRLPPTARVEHRFRRCLVALREAGVDTQGALEAPRGLVHAVRLRGHDDDLPGLCEAVDVWEEVRFGGRGLPVDAEARMTCAMQRLVPFVERRQGVWRSCVLAFAWPQTSTSHRPTWARATTHSTRSRRR
jgi:hypothetical protein